MPANQGGEGAFLAATRESVQQLFVAILAPLRRS
jgi:hypothetical protein